MKKLKLFLFALTLVFITSTTVLAESKWDVENPERLTTSVELKSMEVEKKENDKYIVTVVIAPDVFEKAAKEIYKNEERELI